MPTKSVSRHTCDSLTLLKIAIFTLCIYKFSTAGVPVTGITYIIYVLTDWLPRDRKYALAQFMLNMDS